MERIKAIGNIINVNAIAHSEEITDKLKGLIDKFPKTDDKPRLVFHQVSLKTMRSIVDKLINKIIDKMSNANLSNEKLLIDDAIVDAETNKYKYVGDSLRFVVKVTHEATRCDTVQKFLDEFKHGASASDLANGGILVKFVEDDGFRWEIQFLPPLALKRYSDPESHKLYKDAQRLFAEVQYYLLTKRDFVGDITSRFETLQTEIAKYRKKNVDALPGKCDKSLGYKESPDTFDAITNRIGTLIAANKLDQTKGGRTRRKRQRTTKRKRFTLRKRSHKRSTRRRRTHN